MLLGAEMQEYKKPTLNILDGQPPGFLYAPPKTKR
jgi:hypothetical protein